jgi:nickel/cobalt exporter
MHFADPALLDRADWKTASLTVLAAGTRPCSGAILVLVFALAQGMFLAGIGAVFAMSLGTAVTTGALAAFAVFAKNLAMKFSRPGSRRAVLIVRAIEIAAALSVIGFGGLLLIATLTGTATSS